MQIFETAGQVRGFSRQERQDGRTVGFVPTMGALHEGHVSLVRRAAEECDTVVMSIFVNPLQFNVRNDFDRYPRTTEDDLRLASDAGVAAVYLPTASSMYPEGFDTVVHVERTAAPLEGAGRPGHFDGVATVVTKLLTAVEPDVAVFGQKDYQQLAVVRRLVADLDLPTRIVSSATVRESDGLAMSSRNARLSPSGRTAAAVIKAALDQAADELAASHDAPAARRAFEERLAREPLARLEYVSVADAGTLCELDRFDGPAVVSCAVWLDDVRLIDNVVVVP